LRPRHVPRVTLQNSKPQIKEFGTRPRESIFVGVAGFAAVQLLTVVVGRPPENGDVVRMRRVRAICDNEADHLIIVGLLTSIGKDEGEELPMVYDTGLRLLMRVSDLCVRVRVCECGAVRG
jgi:hypothetical protein